jgi:hypothetical protein
LTSQSGQAHPDRQDRFERELQPLLAHLASSEIAGQELWQAWQIRRISGGWNNILYRVSGPPGDLAVKFAIRDQRDRAGREYGALTALRQAGLSIAPEPILLDRDSFSQPVVVSTWLQGTTYARWPSDDAAWEGLAHHLAATSTVTPAIVATALPPAVVSAQSVSEGKSLILEQMARLPPTARPTDLERLLRDLEQMLDGVSWPAPPIALCRLDYNPLNFVRSADTWRSVDWENSGWSDPAFDVANLITHVACIDVPEERWRWLIAAYCRAVDDAHVARRIRAYCAILAVWWCVRIARYRYEMPRGLDQRLVAPPDDRAASWKTKSEHYARLADRMLQSL